MSELSGRFLPTVVVLAAGRGSRFLGEGHKLEQPWGLDTVLQATVRNALSSRMPVRVVTTLALLPLVESLLPPSSVVVLPQADAQPRLGMGYSIAAGVRSAVDAPGWLILPADMPLVRGETLRRVGAALRHHPVAYPQLQGRRGHPVGFSAELCSELIQLEGDEGARRIVARYPSEAVEVDDAGIFQDFDTVDDFRKASSGPLAGAPDMLRSAPQDF